jgi:TP901 family phage tail tape measure protein
MENTDLGTIHATIMLDVSKVKTGSAEARAEIKKMVESFTAQSRATNNILQKMAGDIGGLSRSYKTLADDADRSGNRVAESQRKVRKELADTVASVKANNEAMRSMGSIFGAGFGLLGIGSTAAALALLGREVKKGVDLAGDLEESLNLLQTQTGATTEEIDRMRQAARALGADTKLAGVSSNDAAEAMQVLAIRSKSTQAAMDGARGSLQLMGVAGVKAGDAADFVGSQIEAFNLKWSETTKVADLVSKALSSTGRINSESFGRMKDAFQASAGVYRMAGLTIEDLTVDIVQMTKAGISGSDAGTSLKTAISRLIAPTGDAKKEMKAHGIEVYEASGKLKSHREIIDQVSQGLAGLTDKQKNATYEVIFGADAIRAAQFVFGAGAEKADALAASLRNTAGAAELSEAKMKGYKGSVEGLGSAWESLLESKSSPIMKFLTGVNEELARAITLMGKYGQSISDMKNPQDRIDASKTDSDHLRAIQRQRGSEAKSAFSATTYQEVQQLGAKYGLTIEQFQKDYEKGKPPKAEMDFSEDARKEAEIAFRAYMTAIQKKIKATATRDGEDIYNKSFQESQGAAYGVARYKLGNITKYGYKGDISQDKNKPDTNSPAGIGAFPHSSKAGSLVENYSLAVSPDIESKFRKQDINIKPGDEVELLLSDGRKVKVRWDDRVPPSYKGKALTGRFDIFSPSGKQPFEGANVMGFSRVGSGIQGMGAASVDDKAMREAARKAEKVAEDIAKGKELHNQSSLETFRAAREEAESAKDWAGALKWAKQEYDAQKQLIAARVAELRRDGSPAAAGGTIDKEGKEAERTYKANLKKIADGKKKQENEGAKANQEIALDVLKVQQEALSNLIERRGFNGEVGESFGPYGPTKEFQRRDQPVGLGQIAIFVEQLKAVNLKIALLEKKQNEIDNAKDPNARRVKNNQIDIAYNAANRRVDNLGAQAKKDYDKIGHEKHLKGEKEIEEEEAFHAKQVVSSEEEKKKSVEATAKATADSTQEAIQIMEKSMGRGNLSLDDYITRLESMKNTLEATGDTGGEAFKHLATALDNAQFDRQKRNKANFERDVKNYDATIAMLFAELDTQERNKPLNRMLATLTGELDRDAGAWRSWGDAVKGTLADTKNALRETIAEMLKMYAIKQINPLGEKGSVGKQLLAGLGGSLLGGIGGAALGSIFKFEKGGFMPEGMHLVHQGEALVKIERPGALALPRALTERMMNGGGGASNQVTNNITVSVGSIDKQIDINVLAEELAWHVSQRMPVS